MQDYLTTREVADYLRLGERKVYDLVAEGKIPCARITGKLLFPRRLVDLWVASQMEVSHPDLSPPPPVIAGSHDPLLDWAVRESGCGLALMVCGSTMGLRHLGQDRAVMAGLHAIDSFGGPYNVGLVRREMPQGDVVLIEWARRVQGLAVASGNPLNIRSALDAARRSLRFVLRQEGAGARLLLRHLLHEDPALQDGLSGPVVSDEAEVAAMVADGKADCGLCIEPVARRLRLDFLPLHLERFDLAMRRRNYFEPAAQCLLAFMRTPDFIGKARELGGYDIGQSGQVSHNS